jgi:hypothetical protein
MRSRQSHPSIDLHRGCGLTGDRPDHAVPLAERPLRFSRSFPVTVFTPRCTWVHAFARETLHGGGGCAAGGRRAGLTRGITFSDLFRRYSAAFGQLSRRHLHPAQRLEPGIDLGGKKNTQATFPRPRGKGTPHPAPSSGHGRIRSPKSGSCLRGRRWLPWWRGVSCSCSAGRSGR